MPAPSLLADNDALLKAAHWDVLDQVPSLVDGAWTSISVLPQFPPRVARAETKLFASPLVASALAQRLAVCSTLPDPDLAVIAALQGQPNLDAGEVLLIAAVASTADARVLTGDKRALRALAPLLALPALSGCAQRFLCVEQMLWCALDILGVEEMVQRVRQWGDRDKTALAIFGSTGAKREEEVREGLRSYIASMDAEAPNVLAPGFGRTT